MLNRFDVIMAGLTLGTASGCAPSGDQSLQFYEFEANALAKRCGLSDADALVINPWAGTVEIYKDNEEIPTKVENFFAKAFDPST